MHADGNTPHTSHAKNAFPWLWRHITSSQNVIAQENCNHGTGDVQKREIAAQTQNRANHVQDHVEWSRLVCNFAGTAPRVSHGRKLKFWNFMPCYTIPTMCSGAWCWGNFTNNLLCVHLCMHPIPVGVPSVLCTELGTKNSSLAFLHQYLRRYGSENLADKSFRYEKSVSNQVPATMWLPAF